MAFIIENRQVSEINNKGKEQFLSFEMKEDYSFKYVPESHFKHIVKNVQRQRRKEDEERIWTSFIQEQELNNFGFCKQDDPRSMLNVKDLLQENIQDVDTELKRLQEDALPERSKRIHNKAGIRREKVHIEASQSKSNSPKEKLLIKDKNNRGTNVSIPISQEDNVSNYKEPEGSKKMSRSKTKKSRSDSLIMQKKYYTNELLRATNHFENNSDSDSSNNKDDIVYIQPDPFMMQKILSMQKKVAELLNEISFRLSRIPLPDGDNDLKSRQQQTVELAIWFSRNYLYNLNRLVTSIQRHIRIMSSKIGLNRQHKNIALHQDMIKQKLITAHQLLVQALNAYCKHIPNSILESHCTKLRDVLQVVYDLGDICDKVEISANYFCSGDTSITSLGKDLREKCDTILSNLKLSVENKNRLAQYKNSESTVTLAPVSSRYKGHVNRKNLSGRLSMYNMDVKISKNNQKKKNILRRKSFTCQKETKNNVVESKNLYVQHCSVPELLYPSPVSYTSSSKDIVQSGSMKNANCLKEEEIKTMMDGVSIDSEHDSTSNTHIKYKNVEQQPTVRKKKSSAEICQSKHTKKKEIYPKDEDVTNDDDLFKKITAISKEHLATLAPVISDLYTLVSKQKIESNEKRVSETSVEALIEFLQKYQSPKDSDTKAPLIDEDFDQSQSKLNGSSNVQKQDGNVRLICMSSMDKMPKTAQCNVSCQADYETTLKPTDDKRTTNLNTKDKVTLTVSKETELQFLSYRSEYQKQCQLKPMYSSNTQNKPWNIVAWISDKLIEELIIEITTELQMNGILITQKMFEMEFQEF